jgi:hypothetical protein
MKFIKEIIFSVIVVFSILLANCVNQKHNIPEWVLNPPVENGTIYGIGFAKSTDSKDASKLAVEKAVISAVYTASFRANEIIREFSNISFNSSTSVELDIIESRNSIQLSWKESDYKIIKLEQTSEGAWWCLAVYEPANIKKIETESALNFLNTIDAFFIEKEEASYSE